jgi:GH15 family glucan-1,4-alpha-glucosidase
VLDSAIYGLWRFGMYPPDDSRVVETMQAIADQLSNKASGGGVARYTDDYYFQVERDTRLVPGNPWFMCTLWLAQWYIATAKTPADLAPAKKMIDWAVTHQLPGGLLSEQLDPHTGAPLSVSPLTWSHAEYLVTVDEYCAKADALRRKSPQTSGNS